MKIGKKSICVLGTLTTVFSMSLLGTDNASAMTTVSKQHISTENSINRAWEYVWPVYRLTTPYTVGGNDLELIQRVVGVKLDGIYGPATANAVKTFQSRNGLKADGVVGPATWEKICRAAPVLRSGSSGGYVSLVQRYLGVQPYDGIYGSKTVAAVKNYQKFHGITADGVVGPNTWKYLVMEGIWE
ncbi:peptidoglycan-binding protein [Bacillus sp. FJAT-49732]|uniref:Peptidoglycan-binding protein n=1 Tax=Lederbergia citrisecunda TaxID=2833583 RepID=A0A942TV90_9BACI|nr:peptidoglycan-binding protein [Lederbergia citrisecunda]MBS4202349.1 peptidoglycan-binding protein [Lederbergia citrisecunda]